MIYLSTSVEERLLKNAPEASARVCLRLRVKRANATFCIVDMFVYVYMYME